MDRLFTEKQVEEIKATTIKDVIISVTNITNADIQDNPFLIQGKNIEGDFFPHY